MQKTIKFLTVLQCAAIPTAVVIDGRIIVSIVVAITSDTSE